MYNRIYNPMYNYGCNPMYIFAWKGVQNFPTKCTEMCHPKDTFTLPRLNGPSATKPFLVDETLQTLAESVRYFKRSPKTLAGRHFRAAEASQTFTESLSELLRSSISLPRLPYSLGRGTFALQLQIELSFLELSTPYGYPRTCPWLSELKRTSQGTWNWFGFVFLIS